MLKPLELTLAIIKPHVVVNSVAIADIRQIILANHFKIVRSKQLKLSHDDACRFYKEHEHKFFYTRLYTFMTSGPLDLYILARYNAIAHWRHLMGPTKVYKTQFTNPDTIRGKYGLSDTRNAVHGSDSVASANKEIGFFFPEFDTNSWYKVEEILFRTNNISYNDRKFLHEVKLNNTNKEL